MSESGIPAGLSPLKKEYETGRVLKDAVKSSKEIVDNFIEKNNIC